MEFTFNVFFLNVFLSYLTILFALNHKFVPRNHLGMIQSFWRNIIIWLNQSPSSSAVASSSIFVSWMLIAGCAAYVDPHEVYICIWWIRAAYAIREIETDCRLRAYTSMNAALAPQDELNEPGRIVCCAGRGARGMRVVILNLTTRRMCVLCDGC